MAEEAGVQEEATRMGAEAVIPESEWKWVGTAGHFVLADQCRWRLHTHVGAYCISSVGNLRDQQGDGPCRLDGAGTGEGPEMFYETMVFEEDGTLEKYGPLTLGEDRYETTKEAQAGHMKMCRKYAEIDS